MQGKRPCNSAETVGGQSDGLVGLCNECTVCDTYYSTVDLCMHIRVSGNIKGTYITRDCKWCGALYWLGPIACMGDRSGIDPKLSCRIQEESL